jgi:hypothetical protein
MWSNSSRRIEYASTMKPLALWLAFCGMACLPARASAACTSPVYSQFDFWVGHWRVTDARGKVVGYDDVTKRLDGCIVYEEYHDAMHPSLGIGMTGYEAGLRRWHQDFMDDGGFVLALDGSMQKGEMILNGTDYVHGKTRLNRGVWNRRGDEVEELWTISLDGGRTWKTRFDGWFHRVPH